MTLVWVKTLAKPKSESIPPSSPLRHVSFLAFPQLFNTKNQSSSIPPASAYSPAYDPTPPRFSISSPNSGTPSQTPSPFRSISKITTTEWQNCTWLRMHKQVDDISRYRNRIPNYFLVKIATLIVEEQYDLAIQAFANGTIGEDEYKKRKSFFLYLDMRRLRITGCSKKPFIRACKKYLYMEDFKVVKMMMNERFTNDEK